jgi:hypothetical protein
MSTGRFQLAEHPRLSLLIVILAEMIGQVLFGVLIIGLFLARYPKPASVVIAALSFGVVHLGNLASGRELAWVLVPPEVTGA